MIGEERGQHVITQGHNTTKFDDTKTLVTIANAMSGKC